MGKPSDSIWALVSGLPSPKRQRWPLLMIETYVDESANDQAPRLLVYASYMATAERWAAFSDDWKACLDLTPRLKYFKMSEAMNFNGLFRHERSRIDAESDRNERVRKFHEIIGRHVMGALTVALDLDAFDKVFRNNPQVPEQMRNKHFFLMFALMHHVGRFSHLFGIDDKIDFIFDEQTRGKPQIFDAWNSFKEWSPVPKHRVGSSPVFKDDQDVLPLQAADMRAWISRRRLVLSSEGKSLEMPWDVANKEFHNGYQRCGQLFDEAALLAHIARRGQTMDRLIRGEFFYLKDHPPLA